MMVSLENELYQMKQATNESFNAVPRLHHLMNPYEQGPSMSAHRPIDVKLLETVRSNGSGVGASVP